MTSSSNLTIESTDGRLSALVATLGSGASQIPPKASSKQTRTAKLTVATAPRFHTAERSRTVASMAARPKQDIKMNPVSKAEAALIELRRMEGIESPRKMSYTPEKESSRLVDSNFSSEQEQPGLAWSKTALNRLICDSGDCDESKCITVQQNESATKGPSPSAIPIEAVAREHDPPMSTAMMAVLKKRANRSSRQAARTPGAMTTSSRTSRGQTSGKLHSHRKTADLAANKSQKNLAVIKTDARNPNSSHPNKVWPDGPRLHPTQTSKTCQAMPLTASNQQTLSSTRGDTEKTVSDCWADRRQVPERLDDQTTKAGINDAEFPPLMKLDDSPDVSAIQGNKHTQPSQVRGHIADLLILEDKELEPVACQSPQRDMMRKATDPAHQRPGLPSHPRTFSSSSLACSQQRRASTGNTFPVSQVTIVSSTAKSHSTVKTGAATILPKRQRWSVDSGSTALMQIKALEASASSNLQTRRSYRRTTGGNSTSISTSSKVMTEGKTSVVTSTQRMGGMPWTPMRSRK